MLQLEYQYDDNDQEQDAPLTAEARWARDKVTLERALWKRPLMDVNETSVFTHLTESRCAKLLRELRTERRVVRAGLGRGRGKRYRYWLTRNGVLGVAEATGWRIPWQVTETGIKWLIRRLPMVEEFYRLTPNLWSQKGVRLGDPIYLTPDPDADPVEFTAGTQLIDFWWMREGEIDAVALYDNGAWVALVWVGSMVTEHKLRDKAALAAEQLGDDYEPAAWVMVGHDRLAAWQAGEFWPGDRVLALSADGRVERYMTPGPFTVPLREHSEPAHWGNPERAVSWLHRNRDMTVLNAELNYRIFRYIAEWHGPIPYVLWVRFGERSRAVARELIRAGLVVKLDGAYYLTRLGMRTVARMDRISPKEVYDRSQIYLDERGAYRLQQQRHNRFLIGVETTLWMQGVDMYGGYRGVRHIEGVTRISPDGVVCLNRRDDTSLPVYLEQEFTADTPGDLGDKLDNYHRLEECLDFAVGLLFVTWDEGAERTVTELASARGMVMVMTTTWPRVMEVTSLGEDSAWRQGDENEDIHRPVAFRELQEAFDEFQRWSADQDLD